MWAAHKANRGRCAAFSNIRTPANTTTCVTLR